MARGGSVGSARERYITTHGTRAGRRSGPPRDNRRNGRRRRGTSSRRSAIQIGLRAAVESCSLTIPSGHAARPLEDVFPTLCSCMDPLGSGQLSGTSRSTSQSAWSWASYRAETHTSAGGPLKFLLPSTPRAGSKRGSTGSIWRALDHPNLGTLRSRTSDMAAFMAMALYQSKPSKPMNQMANAASEILDIARR